MEIKTYSIACEISGPTAMWTRPDTGDAPVSYLAPTYSAVKGIFESIGLLNCICANAFYTGQAVGHCR